MINGSFAVINVKLKFALGENPFEILKLPVIYRNLTEF